MTPGPTAAGPVTAASQASGSTRLRKSCVIISSSARRCRTGSPSNRESLRLQAIGRRLSYAVATRIKASCLGADGVVLFARSNFGRNTTAGLVDGQPMAFIAIARLLLG